MDRRRARLDPYPAGNQLIHGTYGRLASDEDTRYLDDDEDREELRQRYYGLLQELRVVLPGVQVLLAFLLTVPFAPRFTDLDGAGRRAFELALTSSMLSVVFLLGPTFLHRFGERTARRDRLLWSIRLMVVGLGLLGIALLTALWGVARFVFGDGTALQLVVPVAAAMVGRVDRRAVHAAPSAAPPRSRRRLVTGPSRTDLARLHLGLEDVAGAAGELLTGPPLVVLERCVVAVVVLLDDLERPSSVRARCDPAGRAPGHRRDHRDPPLGTARSPRRA